VSGLLNMGGYAAFVWPAYGVSIVMLGAAIAWTWRAYRRALAQLAALDKP
jgi:heme exporter protein D